MFGAVAGELAARWHETRRFVALAFDFCVQAHDAALVRHLDTIYAPLGDAGVARHRYTVSQELHEGARRYALAFDGSQLRTAASLGPLLAYLAWHVNSQAIASSDEYLLLHAAAAEDAGRAVVLPGASGSGKTTLVAALVESGLRYVTDEAVAIAGSSLRIRPYPKPLSIGAGSKDALAFLNPRHNGGVADLNATNWQVQPADWRPDAISAGSTPALVVSPRYRPGVPTQLEPLSGVAAVQMLVSNAFNFSSHGANALRTLAQLARTAPCYRLSVGDLAEACQVVLRVLRAEGPADAVVQRHARR